MPRKNDFAASWYSERFVKLTKLPMTVCTVTWICIFFLVNRPTDFVIDSNLEADHVVMLPI